MKRWLWLFPALALGAATACRDTPVTPSGTATPPGAPLASGVGGAGFTTFNAHVDGAGKDVCKNSAINCNLYGAKEYVWLNGGPLANGLKPDGQYFFAVLGPGGQPNPNDGGALNLSDDYDTYTNRTFTVTNGEVSAYGGTHWLDDGKSGPKPNGKVPYIRLFPYADTPNPGGVYIMAICSLKDGYPVTPGVCNYDAFKVSKQMEMSFMLDGVKFEDLTANATKDAADPLLSGWDVTIIGTGFLGETINTKVTTNASGYWSFDKDYTFNGSVTPVNAALQVCEVLKTGWTQSYPTPSCYTLSIAPAGLAYVGSLDFGNWRPVSVTACKERDLDGVAGGETVPIAGWTVSLTKEGVVVESQTTGADGCYTWTDLTPGFAYDVHEASQSGWLALGPVDYTFATSESNDSFSHTFVNYPLEGCTPGFWQGGNDFGTAGGKWLWNETNDPQWTASGGAGTNPYIWTTLFNSIFTSYSGLNGMTMMDLVGTGGGPEDYQKAARDMVAAYLNASWGMGYAYTTTQLKSMWTSAVGSGDFMSLHLLLDTANNASPGAGCPISASGY